MLPTNVSSFFMSPILVSYPNTWSLNCLHVYICLFLFVKDIETQSICFEIKMNDKLKGKRKMNKVPGHVSCN